MLVIGLLFVALALQNVDAFVTRSWDESYAMANAAIAKMTLAEKAGILAGKGQFSSRCIGDTTPVSRLGIPSMCMNDGPAGVRAVKGVTGFPPAINAASTFSRRLMRSRAKAIGEEFRGKGINVFLGPSVDIMRNPKGGRSWEAFGPDPYLNGEGAYETVMGVQSVGVQACVKHLLGNNQEHWRYGYSSVIDDRTSHEMYFYPFLRAIEADVSSVMCAYNLYNGTSSCQNAGLIGPQGMLRKSGFKGYVVSDWAATHDSPEINANGGLDMEQPGDYLLIGGGQFKVGGSGLISTVNSGKITQARLDEMVARVLAPWYRLGQDTEYPAVNYDAQKPDGSGSNNLKVSVRSAAHTALVREIGAASAVLLKNNRVVVDGVSTRGLPLSASRVKKVAVIGMDAKMAKLDCNAMNECVDGTASVGWGSGSNSLEFLVPPVDAIKTHLAITGGTVTESLSNDINAAVAAARGKDVAFVFVSAVSGELGFYVTVAGNSGDRNDLALWYKGGSMIEAVAAVNSNTVVVVHSVGPVNMSWSNHVNVSAIIYAGLPGEQTGPSIVDVLYGARNPSGRLPFSIADAESAYPAPIVYGGITPVIEYKEKLLLDYRFMDQQNIEPRYPFGFGLSYTTFGYSGFSTASSGSSQTVTFTVANTGAVDGTEIAQLYLGFPASAGEPKKVLRGFEEVILKAGAASTVTLTMSQRDMSIWDVVKQDWVRPSGTFTVYVGGSIKDVRWSGSF